MRPFFYTLEKNDLCGLYSLATSLFACWFSPFSMSNLCDVWASGNWSMWITSSRPSCRVASHGVQPMGDARDKQRAGKEKDEGIYSTLPHPQISCGTCLAEDLVESVWFYSHSLSPTAAAPALSALMWLWFSCHSFPCSLLMKLSFH